MSDKTIVYQDGRRTGLTEIPADGKWYEAVTAHGPSNEDLSLGQIVQMRVALAWAKLRLRLGKWLLRLDEWLCDVEIPAWPGEETGQGDGWQIIVQRSADTRDVQSSDLVPLDSVVTEDGARVWPCHQQMICPQCKALVRWQAAPGQLAIAACDNCHRQFPVRDGQVVDPGQCDFSCGSVEPYGFVPEAGCPVHDLEQTNG